MAPTTPLDTPVVTPSSPGNRLNLDLWTHIIEELLVSHSIRKEDSKQWSKPEHQRRARELFAVRLVCKNAAAAANPILFYRLTLPSREKNSLYGYSPIQVSKFFESYVQMMHICSVREMSLLPFFNGYENLHSLSINLSTTCVGDGTTAKFRMLSNFLQNNQNSPRLLIGLQDSTVVLSTKLDTFEAYSQQPTRFAIGSSRLEIDRHRKSIHSSRHPEGPCVEEIVFEQLQPSKTLPAAHRQRFNLKFPPMRRLTLTEHSYFALKETVANRLWDFSHLEHLTMHIGRKIPQFRPNPRIYQQLRSLTLVCQAPSRMDMSPLVGCSTSLHFNKLVLLGDWYKWISWDYYLLKDTRMETLVVLNGWRGLLAMETAPCSKIKAIAQKYPNLKELAVQADFRKDQHAETQEYLATLVELSELQILHLHFNSNGSIDAVSGLFLYGTSNQPGKVDVGYDGASLLFDKIFAGGRFNQLTQVSITVRDAQDEGARIWNPLSLNFEKVDPSSGKGFRRWVADWDESDSTFSVSGDLRMRFSK